MTNPLRNGPLLSTVTEVPEMTLLLGSTLSCPMTLFWHPISSTFLESQILFELQPVQLYTVMFFLLSLTLLRRDVYIFYST